MSLNVMVETEAELTLPLPPPSCEECVWAIRTNLNQLLHLLNLLLYICKTGFENEQWQFNMCIIEMVFSYPLKTLQMG